MLYRRKILRALMEVFDVALAQTDFETLIFLFCMRRKKNYYDFFPAKHGFFSFLLQQDMSCLVDSVQLMAQERFQAETPLVFFTQLQVKDQQVLQSMVEEMGNLRGNELTHKVYAEYHSDTLDDTGDGYEHQVNGSENGFCLFTLGYEGLSIDAYLCTLLANQVRALIDVRKNPISRKAGFSKTKLANYSQAIGISYYHIPDLGVPSALRRDLTTDSAYQSLFDFYAAQILPAHSDAIEELKELLHVHKRIVLTCFEADHRFCHRHKIVEHLAKDPYFSIPVVHLNEALASGDKIQYTNTSKETLHLCR